MRFLTLPLLLGAEVTTGGADLRADEMRQDNATQRAVAEGHVVARMGSLILHCPRLDYDGKTRQMVLSGPIFAIDAKNVLIARRAEVDLETEGVTLYGVRLVQKTAVSPETLARAETVEQALHSGRTIAVVTGEEVVRRGPGHYSMRDLSMSPCDCPDPGGACVPDWAVRAPSADVHAGEYTLLDVPTIRVHDVPVLVLPILYMPLAKRRTGFLLPHLSWQHQNGFLIDEPFFLTLGDSYDLTATLGYITGAPQIASGGFGPGANGVKGVRTSLEFRYAPDPETYGRFFTTLLNDENSDFVAAPGQTPSDPNGYIAYRRGLRGSLHETQDQYFADGSGDHLDINLVTDARLTSQLTTDILYATVPATRSSASAFYRQSDFLVTGQALVFQDFYGAFGSDNVHRLLFGSGSPRTLAELPVINLDVAELPLGRSPFHFDLQTSFASFFTPGSPYDLINVSQSSLANPVVPPAPGASTLYYQGRPGMLRLDALPSLAVDVPRNAYVNGSLRLSLRGDLWLFESAPVSTTLTGPQLGQFGARGYPIIDLQLGTEISRTFGEGSARLRHTIDPLLDLRAIPVQGLAGTVAPLWLSPGTPIQDHYTGSTIGYSQPLVYDQIDAAAGLSYPGKPGSTASIAASSSPAGLAQGDLHLLQTLHAPRGDQFVSLDVGEYFDDSGFEATYGRRSPSPTGRCMSSGLRHLPQPREPLPADVGVQPDDESCDERSACAAALGRGRRADRRDGHPRGQQCTGDLLARRRRPGPRDCPRRWMPSSREDRARRRSTLAAPRHQPEPPSPPTRARGGTDQPACLDQLFALRQPGQPDHRRGGLRVRPALSLIHADATAVVQPPERRCAAGALGGFLPDLEPRGDRRRRGNGVLVEADGRGSRSSLRGSRSELPEIGREVPRHAPG